MVVFRPFRGCRYNPDVAGEMASLLCPPYDLIGGELKSSLQKLSPYNAVHLEGGEPGTRCLLGGRLLLSQGDGRQGLEQEGEHDEGEPAKRVSPR